MCLELPFVLVMMCDGGRSLCVFWLPSSIPNLAKINPAALMNSIHLSLLSVKNH